MQKGVSDKCAAPFPRRNYAGSSTQSRASLTDCAKSTHSVSELPMRLRRRIADLRSAPKARCEVSPPLEASACERGPVHAPLLRVNGQESRKGGKAGESNVSPGGATHHGFEKTNIHFSGRAQFQPRGCSLYLTLPKPHAESPNMSS
jgi:hypothetical protein